MKKKSKEKSLLFSQSKKIEILKNIYINLKCLKSKEDYQIKKKFSKDKSKTNKNSFSEINKNKDIKKNSLKNRNIKQKSKTKKNFYSNSNNNSIKKSNIFFKNRIMKKPIKSLSHTQSTLNNKYKSHNNIRYDNKKNNSKANIILTNDNKIYQNNPLELTFGSISFMSNIQTEANENDKNKGIKIKNKTFLASLNNNITKEKKDFKRHNKIIKLKKKLFFNPDWKIKQKNNKSINKSNNINNKSEIIIKNYKTKKKYEIINNNYTNININYREKNYHSVNISNEIRKSNKKINIRSEKDKMKKNELIKNKLIKNRNEKEKFKNKKCRNYTAKNSDILQKSTLKKIKSSNNNKEYIIRININNKENGRYKLIIKRINQYKKRMPRSAPKLFLAHPSLKNLFL